MALRCELVARKNYVAWKWAVVTNLMLEDSVEIADMAAARDFAVYLTSTGSLLQCGERPRRVSYEQFLLRQGRRRGRAHAVGTQFKRLSMRERERQAGHVCDLTCCPFELPTTEKVQVLQVACGATHCVVLGEVGDADGKKRGLFAWGLGEYGQLGLGEIQTVATMTPVTTSPELQLLLQNSDGTHPLILRCGMFSTYLLSRGSSTLWHWGLLPSAEKDAPFVRQGVPVKFPLLEENTQLVDVAAGVEHVVLLSKSGCVFTWGYGSSGQLGLGPMTSNVGCEHPSQVDFFRQETNYSIAAISCGWNHTVAVSKSGEVFAWGSNASGACGAKSKFCEYFQPVLVAVPRPVELGLSSPDLQAEVRCGGNTSVLLLLRRLKTTCVSIERAFKWGVGSAGTCTLLPVEVFSFGVEQSTFESCSMRLECSMWLFRTGVKQETPLGWIVNEINARAVSHQGIEEGLPCLEIGVGAQICVRAQAITKTAAAAIETLPASDGTCIDTHLFTLALQHDDSALTSDQQVSNDQAPVSILTVSRKSLDKKVQANSSVDIILLAQSTGKTIISLGSVTGEIIGGTFEVDVAPQRENEAENIATAHDANGGQDNTINILGIHVEGNVTESQERVDTNWYKLQSKRIRVHTEDDVIVLIESTANDLNPAVQVEFRDSQWQYGLTHLDVISSDGESRGQNLGVVQLRFLSPGEYFIYDTNHHSEDDNDDRSPVLIVSSCLAHQERHQIIAENNGIVSSKYQSALVKAHPPAQFSYFLSSILQHHALRDAVVCSPWTTTYDAEWNELPFDFDRESDAQRELLHHPEFPFILWNPYVDTAAGLGNWERPSNRREDSPSLNSILPAWAELMASNVAFRIATWLEKPHISAKESPKNFPIDYEKARLEAAATGLSVQQIPFDFLSSVHHHQQRAVREALAPVNPNIMGVHDSIVSWRRTNGDLFYTVQSIDLRVKRYGHESHDFPETAQSGRITRLKSQLSDFLWQATKGKKIEEIFFLLATPIDPESQQFEDCSRSSNASVNSVIHLRELIIHSTALGFDEVAVVLKQEWFALFRGIQALSSSSAGITFCTLRTFLIDPFHQFFWKQYVHRIREQANLRREMVVFALVQSFELVEGDASRVHRNNDTGYNGNTNDGEVPMAMAPWPDFVENLRSFHTILGLKALPAPDCCRLLYRFDTFGNGHISVQAFQSTILHELDEINAASKDFDVKSSSKAQPGKSPKGRPLKVAIANGHRRPNVELFTSSEAVHKLFAARAKRCSNSKSQSQLLPGDPTHTRVAATNRANDAAATLRASANTHLARIRNLPISHLLREGIYFRPPRKALYRCEDERDHTQAQTMGAEDSY